MNNKFHPDDLKNPLYEYSQVITLQDLKFIFQGLQVQYQSTRWWEVRRRYHLHIACQAVAELLSWLYDGKASLRDTGGQI